MSAGEESRDNAEIFGDLVEDASGNIGDAVDALQGESPDQPQDNDGGGDITINIDR
jgi:hypothetical protein